jgi:hypothetical protein
MRRKSLVPKPLRSPRNILAIPSPHLAAVSLTCSCIHNLNNTGGTVGDGHGSLLEAERSSTSVAKIGLGPASLEEVGLDSFIVLIIHWVDVGSLTLDR